LTVLVGLSLVSLASGTPALFIQRGLSGVVSFTSRPVLKAFRATRNGTDYVAELILSYDSARSEANHLRQRLAEVLESATYRREVYAENRRLREMLGFVHEHPELQLMPAEVIQNYRGILKIDRGSVHGLADSMGVVTEEGVVGVITEVHRSTATVVTLHSVDCRIGAMIRRNRVRGILHGSGSDLSRLCTMEYIDMKEAVTEGDPVVASPESLFPSGYPIGRVEAVHSTGTLWKAADIEPAANPYRVDEVFVVLRASPPIEDLTGPWTPPATAASRAPELPDDRSMQERYAP